MSCPVQNCKTNAETEGSTGALKANPQASSVQGIPWSPEMSLLDYQPGWEKGRKTTRSISDREAMTASYYDQIAQAVVDGKMDYELAHRRGDRVMARVSELILYEEVRQNLPLRDGEGWLTMDKYLGRSQLQNGAAFLSGSVREGFDNKIQSEYCRRVRKAIQDGEMSWQTAADLIPFDEVRPHAFDDIWRRAATMPFAEFVQQASRYADNTCTESNLREMHQATVAGRFAFGEAVPGAVLSEYPDIDFDTPWLKTAQVLFTHFSDPHTRTPLQLTYVDHFDRQERAVREARLRQNQSRRAPVFFNVSPASNGKGFVIFASIPRPHPADFAQFQAWHRSEVRMALLQGYPVPADVRSEYENNPQTVEKE